MSPQTRVPTRRPYRTLLEAFLAWKLFLFAIAFGCSVVGGAYDTSAGLVVQGSAGSNGAGAAGLLTGLVGPRLLARFTSWDAIYFVSIARRGYRFEQEWAFGGGLPVVVGGILKGERLISCLSN
jgi:phosphatidylinositol glycan class V